jgi:hypothetical protein
MNNEVLHILSHDGSLEFKQQIAYAENMVRNPSTGVDDLDVIINRLHGQKQLLLIESNKPDYTKNQITTMKTYINKLNRVIMLLTNRMNEIYISQARRRTGGRRKSSRRKSSRRKSIRRRKY